MNWLFNLMRKIFCGDLINENKDLDKELRAIKILFDKAKAEIEKLTGEEIFEPTIKDLIDYSSLMNLLKNKLKDTTIYLSDNIFGLVKLDEAKVFLSKDRTDLKKYEAEIHDCDDFSRVLWFYWRDWSSILAMGMAWSRTHAFNILVDNKKDIYIIEPQNDIIMPLSKAKTKPEYFPMRFVIM